MKHIMYFVAYVFMGAFLIVGIEFLAGIEVPGGMSLTLGVIGSIGMGWSFARDHNRTPTNSEKRRLVIGVFTVMMALNFIIVGLLLKFDTEFQQIVAELGGHWQFMLIVYAIVLLLYFAIIWFCFGYFASMFLKQQKEKASASTSA